MKPVASIVVIDDVPSVQELIRESLVGLRVEILGAVTGMAGLGLIADVAPDLVVLDLALPGIDGWQVLEALESAGAHPPVLIVTAHGQSGMESRARAAGAAGFLEKPFRPVELRRAVVALLAGG